MISNEDNRPPFWSNETPLLYPNYSEGSVPNMMLLPLQDFPEISDFEVRLESIFKSGHIALAGCQVMFFSAKLGYLAGFPWWDNAEHTLIQTDFVIPLGDFQKPFMDLEQGWEIVISANDNYVYILEGRFDQREYDGYAIWFKVQKHLYCEQWYKAIASCQSLAEIE